jgi:hypothetical protein
MFNVISFRERVARYRGSQRQPPTPTPDAEPAIPVMPTPSQPQEDEVRQAIFMLDLAVQYARLVAGNMSDATIRKSFDEHISAIEHLLQVTRNLVLKR